MYVSAPVTSRICCEASASVECRGSRDYAMCETFYRALWVCHREL
jgi:hypothetical protein